MKVSITNVVIICVIVILIILIFSKRENFVMSKKAIIPPGDGFQGEGLTRTYKIPCYSSRQLSVIDNREIGCEDKACQINDYGTVINPSQKVL